MAIRVESDNRVMRPLLSSLVLKACVTLPALVALGVACGGSGGSDGAAGTGSATSGTGATSSGTGSSGNGSGTGGGTSSGTGGFTAVCSAPSVKITEVDVGLAVNESEDEVGLKPLMISPLPGGGSRVAFMGDDGKVHVATLDGSDALVGTPIAIDANDYGDLYADENGGVLLVTRDAEGGGTLNCGEPTNLCGTPPSPPVPCYDMYMVRFDGENETWATKLTTSSAALPPYSTGKTGPEVYMIWWYAHHGRLASDGTNFAGYYGSGISVSQDGCINIHQGDRMQVVSPSGDVLDGHDSFDWGCSHSGYERITYDSRSSKFVTVCKTDNNNRIAHAPGIDTIKPVDLAYANLSDVVPDTTDGYFAVTSDKKSGQPDLADGLAELHLLHFKDGEADNDIVLPSEASENVRAPYLARLGTDALLLGYETSTETGDLRRNDESRKFFVQIRSAATGEGWSEPVEVAVDGNRYQTFRTFPDGSAAYIAPGSSGTKIKVVRVAACAK